MKNALISAIPIGVGMTAVCLFIAAIRWPQLAQDPSSSAVVFIGLPLVAFLTYFFLALAGYTVRSDGSVAAPRRVAWYVVALITITVFSALFYIFLGR